MIEVLLEPKILLVILDGFGHNDDSKHNAIAMAQMPNWTRIVQNNPHSLLNTSGEAVGLPHGIMGNSEVGHLNIGGGRIIPQELTRIANFARENGFESLSDVRRVMEDKTGALHFIGLLSDGGVHSDQEHLYLLLEAANRVTKNKPIYIHVITDGRDTPPSSGKGYIQQLQKRVDRYPNVKIASVIGRFYVMDRDKRWDRVQKAYEALIGHTPSHSPGEIGSSLGSGFAGSFPTAAAAIEDAYNKGETDEFVIPRLIESAKPISSEDQVIFFNFRADRAREISQAFGVPGFKEFPTPVKIQPKNWVTFTSYQKDFPFPVLFHPQTYTHLLGEEVARHGKKQLRIAETEKYAHVTYFFNGGVEKEFEGEDRILIPSPKEVKTYDLKPEMSAYQVTDDLVKAILKDQYSLIVVNYANGDMVGHTGIEKAAVKAVEALDECLGRISQAALEKGYDILITADHGNVEQMIDPRTNQPFTQHTTNPVPFVWIGERNKGKQLKNGILADVAPTILQLLGWEQPKEMTGHSLII